MNTPIRSGQSRRRRAFTLVELVLAMMVTGIILSAVVMMAWALGSYNNEGEASVALATHSRYAMMRLGREIRAARALSVTGTGGLVLWLGDLNSDKKMQINEFVIFYRASDSTLRRIEYEGTLVIGNVTSGSMLNVKSWFDSGLIYASVPSYGITAYNDVVGRYVDALTFAPNAAYPSTLAVEIRMRLSRAEDLVDGAGRRVELNAYDMATMRVPYEGDGFTP